MKRNGVLKMKKRISGRKAALIAIAAAALLIAAGFAVRALIVRGPAPARAGSDTAAATDAPEASASGRRKSPAWELPQKYERLNVFLTSVVQQNIENTKTDLDEDAELIRFAFGYRKTADPDSFSEREYEGVLCPALTLGQVNETLTYFFGKTVSPDREDYRAESGGSADFNCVFRDGVFLNVPPYPTEKYDFPLRFALVESVDEETCTLHFRLYRINPDDWGEGEAGRHVPFLPIMSVYDAENKNGETRNWITRLGKGEAVLRDLGDELRLVEMTCSLYYD